MLRSVLLSLPSELSYSTREAAGLIGVSREWLRRRHQQSDLVRPDGTPIEPRSPENTYGYPRYTLEGLRDLLLVADARGWLPRVQVIDGFGRILSECDRIDAARKDAGSR